MRKTLVLTVALFTVMVFAPGIHAQGGPPGGDEERPWDTRRRAMKDRLGGLDSDLLALQRVEVVEVPELRTLVARAQAAGREAAVGLIDVEFHTGSVLRVPGDHTSIQEAIDAAVARDTIIVGAGTYHELLVMKDGVRLVSDAAAGGEELVEVEGAMTRLPRRTLRTILDGSRSTPSHHGMIDFAPGLGRHTIVDGFTIQNLPRQDHHIPGHAHGINVRGASPILMNCLLRDLGSTGIGNHVVYRDADSPMAERDFRSANVAHQASPVILGNIICRSFGLGIGCNHLSSPFILANEVFANDDSELDGETTPGIGGQHGMSATIVGNIIHDNPGGGILCKQGSAQGKHPIDTPTHPTIEANLVYDNGLVRPGISAFGAGDVQQPVRIAGNWVIRAGAVGIGLSGGAVGVIVDNLVAGSRQPGISVNGAVAHEVCRNRVTGSEGAGFAFADAAEVKVLEDNVAHEVRGPRFMVLDATFGEEEARPGEAK